MIELIFLLRPILFSVSIEIPSKVYLKISPKVIPNDFSEVFSSSEYQESILS